jgi:diguanylate cyclase (GGDEF)-like protein
VTLFNAELQSNEANRRPQLLIVDDQPLNIHVLYQIFQTDHDVFLATSGADALAYCEASLPDLILMDVLMPGLDGNEVCRRLKRDPLTRKIPVIFVSAHGDTAREEQGFAAGAVDFIAKSASPNVMRARVKTHLTLKYQTDLLRSLAWVDGLTGVANRRHFDHALDTEWRRCTRSRKPLSLILIDLDFFKRFNDCYGHQEGDACLRRVAACIKAGFTRSHDLVARYGGEEFVCVLPETSLEGAQTKAQALQLAILALAIPHERSDVIGGLVSVSMGVAVATPTQRDESGDLIRCADNLLYSAKQAGRGQAKVMQV